MVVVSRLSVVGARDRAGAACVTLHGPEEIRQDLSVETGVKLDRDFTLTVNRGGMWMAKKGLKTLSLDRNLEIGHGSTAGSCAIIRMHYSTFDGTAFAWEGYHYWRDWADYLTLGPGANLAKFRETGCLVMKTEENGHLEKHIENSRKLEIPFEEWDEEQILQRMPIYSLESYHPPRTRDDADFGLPNGKHVRGAVFWPNGGYVTDPALSSQNLADAARKFGADFRLGVDVTEILKAGGRVTDVVGGDSFLESGEILAAGPALHETMLEVTRGAFGR